MLLNDNELLPFFDFPEMLTTINSSCNVTNAVKKSERKYFAYSHVTCLLDFYFASQSTKLSAVKTHIDAFVQDMKESGYFLAGYLAALNSVEPRNSVNEKAKLLIEDLAGQKVPLDTFRHATFYLSLQNFAKTLKLKIDNAKYDHIEASCGAATATKNLSKYFDDITADDSINTAQIVPFFDAVCTNILARSNEKTLSKLFKFFQHALESIEKDKNLRQKRAFHLVGFFRNFLQRVDPQILLSLDVEQSINRKNTTSHTSSKAVASAGNDSESVADIFTNLVDFWLKQVGNKNAGSRLASVELDHAWADKLKQCEKGVASKLALFVLKVTKHSPTNSIRGGDLRLMQTVLGILYQDEKAFEQYFNLLKDHVRKSTRVAEVNFFLNELEHLGQVGLTAKLHKGLDGEKETNMRLSVLKFLTEFYMNCDSEASLDSYLAGKDAHKSEGRMEWNEQELSFKKFRTKAFERICNLVFKRDDTALLTKGAEQYAKSAIAKNAEIAPYFKLLTEAIQKLGKNKAELASLLRGLTFMNIFEDDIEKNFDLVADVAKTSVLMEGTAKQSPIKKVKTAAAAGNHSITIENGGADAPESLFVDAMVGLCSTTQPQLKPLISAAFETCCDRLGEIGFSFLLQAIVKPDSQYLNDDGEDEEGEGEGDEEGEDHEEEGAGEDDEDAEDLIDNDIEDDEEVEELLGKRAKQSQAKPRVDKQPINSSVKTGQKQQNGVSKSSKIHKPDAKKTDHKVKA